MPHSKSVRAWRPMPLWSMFITVGPERNCSFVFPGHTAVQAAAIARKEIRRVWPHVTFIRVQMDTVKPAPPGAVRSLAPQPLQKELRLR